MHKRLANAHTHTLTHPHTYTGFDFGEGLLSSPHPHYSKTGITLKVYPPPPLELSIWLAKALDVYLIEKSIYCVDWGEGERGPLLLSTIAAAQWCGMQLYIRAFFSANFSSFGECHWKVFNGAVRVCMFLIEDLENFKSLYLMLDLSFLYKMKAILK